MEDEHVALARLLEKKATFSQGLRALSSSIASTSPNNDSKLAALLGLLPRTMTLLRTRYTNPAFWKQFADVCRQAEAQCTQPEQKARVHQCLGEADAFLAEHDVELAGSVAASREAFAAAALANVPLEDIMMGVGAGARQGIEAHYDDTGPILDDEERRLRIEGGGVTSTFAGQGEGAAPAAGAGTGAGAEGQGDGTGTAATADAVADGQGPGGTGDAAGRTRQQQRAHMQASILEGIQAVYSGMSAIARGTEAIERELDAVLATLHSRAEAAAAPSRPPASRRVVAALPRLKVDEEMLERLGKDSQCSVCTELLAVGEEVQLLPCKHGYHVDCLKPWLEKNNTCPLCRTELPTDDAGYEARKEREAEEAHERRGAANALSHSEFAYI